MENYFENPESDRYAPHYQGYNSGNVILKVNGHIHTPYSFSAFSGIEQPFVMAAEEEIAVLGINDFYTTDGYAEFAQLAKSYRIFPLFNIEFMALQKAEQADGTRINDPQNPGRTYLSGKGLRFPVQMSDASHKKMETLMRESNRQTWLMVEKLNQFLAGTSTGLSFDAGELHQKLARNLFRERHIATGIRLALSGKYKSEAEIRSALKEIFGGRDAVSDPENTAALENEVRNNLLKAGGPAYVAEDEKAFLSLEEVISLITDAGGIPCYPVLLDDAKGNFTEFEADAEKLARQLKEKGIFMIELIPGRNEYSVLKNFVSFFDKQGFIITFGSEHNTPQLDPLTITCRGKVPLDDELLRINYRGASVIAAHQYLHAKGEKGFPVSIFPSAAELDKLALMGHQVIMNFIR
jgi:predicted metal-dependent phosphoesterase TrpH